MVREQISFAVVDHELLASAKVRDADMRIGRQWFSALVLPAGVELPKSSAEKVARFKSAGGQVFREKDSGAGIDFNALAGVYKSGLLSVRSDRVVVGRFIRDGREILAFTNVAARPYVGAITAKNAKAWLVADPASGRIEPAKIDEAGRIALSLSSRGAVVLIGPPTTTTALR
jgi:hypothetical protein